MVDLAPGTVVTVVQPSPVVSYTAPGIVNGLWLKEGPAGPPGADGTDGTNGADGADGADGLVQSVNGQSVADVELDASDIPYSPFGATEATDVQAAINEVTSEKAPKHNAAFTGTMTAPTAAASDDSTTVANTAHVKDAIQGGSVVAIGTTGGSISLSSHLTAATAVNAVVTITLNANTTFTAATMPTVAAGTQFAMRITQDGAGSRTLTLTNIRKPGGALALSTAAAAVDLIVFFYDGTNWYAALSGKAFAA